MIDKLSHELNDWTLNYKQEFLTPEIIKKLNGSYVLAKKLEAKVDVFTYVYTVDKIKVAGFLVSPKDSSMKLPVIIFNRGGTGNYGLVPIGKLFTFIARIASWGFLVIGSQYPGNMLSEGLDERGGKSDVQSILHLYELIKHLSCANQENIGMYGISRGGMMTYLCLKEVTWIKAALTVSGLADLKRSLKARPEMSEIYKNSFGNTVIGKRARSAVSWADKLCKDTPLCILHGTADDKVSPLDAFDLGLKLYSCQHPFSLYLLQNGDHGLTNLGTERDELVKEWFSRYLKGS